MVKNSPIIQKTINAGVFICVLIFLGLDAKGQVVIPYTLTEDGFYLVDVKVNEDQIFPFIVDTAAQNTSLYLHAVQALGLESIPGRFTMVQGVNGQIKTALHDIKSIDLLGARMENFSSASTPKFGQDDYHIGGILGMDFLANYQVEFNCIDQTLRLHNPRLGSINKAEVLDQLTFDRPIANFILFDVQIQGEPSIAILDTGARRHLTNWASATKMDIKPGDLGVKRDAEVSGAAGKFPGQASKFEFADILISNQQWSNQSITIADVDVFNFFPIKNQPAIILGTPLFRHARFMIDYKKKTLNFLSTVDKNTQCKSKSS